MIASFIYFYAYKKTVSKLRFYKKFSEEYLSV